ncbi:TnpV protein [uncultured Cloacibacillus sp.]|uniref:TnpV protein n=1 Tax=uncultured Cloacibacillus sp. TaxID=889794 RepID=UPI0032096E72
MMTNEEFDRLQEEIRQEFTWEDWMQRPEKDEPEEEPMEMAELPKRKIENGIPYVLVGDYYIPDLRAEEAIPERIGRFGRERLRYLEENKPEEVHKMILAGNLNETLEQLNEQVEDKIRELMQEMLRKNPAPDKMKHQLEWVGHMNMMREKAIEIARSELIYV